MAITIQCTKCKCDWGYGWPILNDLYSFLKHGISLRGRKFTELKCSQCGGIAHKRQLIEGLERLLNGT